MIFLNLFLVVVYCRYALSTITKMEKYLDSKQVNSYNTGYTEHNRRHHGTESIDAAELAEFYDELITEQPPRNNPGRRSINGDAVTSNPDIIKIGDSQGNPQQIFNIYNKCCDEKNVERDLSHLPPDYAGQISESGAHKFHNEPKDWNDARNVCIGEGGHLAVIVSTEEEKKIAEWSIANNIEEAWLGVHEQFQKDDWVTVTDKPLKDVGYEHWLPNEPNNYKGNEHCLSYYLKTGYNDRDCSVPLPFICTIPLK